ncbi:hypothetical protein RB2654_21548 [Rhodobacterales bacterium HTCC2654]|nr:hypothetical protein RB2654_21548 [Rhodobacterales bacterium HTCC2654] [Maritimibacter alkaliphilus HTCC2654]
TEGTVFVTLHGFCDDFDAYGQVCLTKKPPATLFSPRFSQTYR